MIGYLAVLQARMASARLPGKVMLPLCGKPVIWHVAERVRLAGKIDKTIVATSEDQSCDMLCSNLESSGIEYIRGSEIDVLGRFRIASLHWPSSNIVRVTCDNPLVDPGVLDNTIGYFESAKLRYVNTGDFPIGIGAEVFTTELLEEAHLKANTAYEREHVTPYMYTGQPSHGSYRNSADLGSFRLTLDTEQDYEVIKDIYTHYYKGAHDFFYEDVIAYLQSNGKEKHYA